MVLTTPLYWGANFLQIALYTAAMIITAALIRIVPENKNVIRSAYLSVLHFSKDLLFLSVKLFVLTRIASLFVFPFTKLFMHFPRSTFLSASDFGYILGTTLAIGIAYIITPAATKLLRQSNVEPVSAELILYARYFAIFTVIASAALARMTNYIEPSLSFRSIPLAGILVFQMTGSLIAAVPYIFLFIILACIALSSKPQED